MTLENILECTVGATLIVFASWTIWFIAFNKFWRAIDEHIAHRCRMLMAELLAEAIGKHAGSEPVRQIERPNRNRDATDEGQGSPVRWSDGTERPGGTNDPGPIYSAASPPSLSIRPVKKAKEPDEWSEGSKAKLPVVLQPVDTPVDPEALKRWVQPGLDLPRPISPPSGSKRPSRAGKKGRKGAKAKGRKKASPGQSSMALAKQPKKVKDINGSVMA